MARTINMHTDLQISSCWEHIITVQTKDIVHKAIDSTFIWLFDWLIDYWGASSEQYFEYIQDKNKLNNLKTI